MNAVESCRTSSLSRLSSQELRAKRPDLERREPMLWQMLEAGAFLDESLWAELGAAAGGLACGPGCDACCWQAIPMTLAEGLAISIFLRLAGLPLPKQAITGYLDDNCNGGEIKDINRCPFLRDGCCTVYPARPFACRRFLVFRTPCARGEDPTLTRPADVFQPSPKKLFEALCLTLPIYGRLAVPVPAKVTRQFFSNHTHVIQAFPWHVIRR